MGKSSPISHIIFDFGNVLYDLNFNLFHQNLTSLFPLDPIPEAILENLISYEKGLINTENFLWNIQFHTKSKLSPYKLIEIWNSLLVDIPKQRIKMLKALAENYSLSLLSNINDLHISKARAHLKNDHQIEHFEKEFFDACFYSCEIGYRKPEAEIYSFVTEVLNIDGNQILFIDDLVENVEAARKQGWNAIVHDPNKDISECILSYLN